MWVSVRSEHGAKLEIGKGFSVLCNLNILKLDLNLSYKPMLSKMFFSFEMVYFPLTYEYLFLISSLAPVGGKQNHSRSEYKIKCYLSYFK